MKSIRQYHARQALVDADLEDYLVGQGWFQANAPGTVNMWQKRVGDRTLVVTRETAVYIQGAIELVEDHVPETG